MKVLAEFVDTRNGNRYKPGADLTSAEPPLSDQQVAALIAGGYVEPAPVAAPVTDLQTSPARAQRKARK